MGRPVVDVRVETDSSTLDRLDGTSGSVVVLNVSVVLPEATMSSSSLNVSVPVGDAEEFLLQRVSSVRVLRGGVEQPSPNNGVLSSSCVGVGSGGFDLESYMLQSSLFVGRGSGVSWYSVPLCAFRNVDREDGSLGALSEVLEVVLEGTI